ncbi:hypothetical protein [Aureibacter tunicatorum]|uniref:Uncharacterized protein n=1 Tax=Aureibacter tunicatorum TaxID=866807 RepID=A0AAE4BSN6_9BACT|nr:hypothetical protein [Aureibacter tunicatorum]MDR6239966.1 hypothetical protein [Aureibacter tunicatorum]BDD04439.1 hypothetical protein AUTU_19220 [Aureibacter tunicatorum]
MGKKKYNVTDFDLDIFKFNSGLLCHFATAGGNVYSYFEDEGFHNELRIILRESNFEFKYEINRYLERIIDHRILNQGFDRDKYLHDFVGFAKKGLFSFDKTFLHDSEDLSYHLVAYPIFENRSQYFDLLEYCLESLSDEFKRKFKPYPRYRYWTYYFSINKLDLFNESIKVQL